MNLQSHHRKDGDIMPHVDESIWLAPENAYTGFNLRTGTSDINDPDFTDFPPISLCTYSSAAAYKQLLYQWINGNKLSLDDEIDKTICYVGMYSSELPQLNIVGLYNNTKNTLDDPLYKTDNTQIQSFIFTGITNYNEFADYLTWGSSQLYTDTFTYTDYKLLRYKGGILGTAPNVSPQRNANCNGFLNIFQNLGIKCFILEINVKYKTGTDSSGVTVSTYTLKEYTQQTDAWKAEHPIVSAYCRPFWRSNKNGTYSYTKPSGYFCELMPVFTLPYKSNDNDITDVVSYHTNVCRTTATRTGYFPIYGAIKQELSTSVMTQAVEEQGRAALLVGANRGTLNSQTVSGYKNYWLELDGTNADNIEYIRRGAAAYGMFFCDDIGTLADSGQDVTRWLEDDMCLGTIDENGLTNGDYTHGAMNATGRQYSWKTINDSDYDPSRPPVPQNEYSNTTTFNSIGDIVTLTQRYVLNGTAVSHLGRELWQITADMIDDGGGGEDFTELNDKILDTFLTNNPIDCIVSLQRYPMEIPKTNSPVKIKLGKAETNVSAYQMEKTAYTYLFTGKTIQPKFGDSFLDYEPYTRMELYIPFCGTVQMNPADILGRDLNVQLVVDFTTGTCTGYVMSDDLVIETVSGNIAIDIPVTGIQSATVASQLNNAIANKMNANKQSMQATLGNVSVGGVIRAVKDPLNMMFQAQQAEITEQRADYELRHQTPTVHVIGAASPVGGWAIDLNCRLIIYYPSGDVIRTAKPPEWNDTTLARYGRTTGFACCIESAIEDIGSGLVVGTAPDLQGMITDTQSYAATVTELDMIRAAIGEGVIV